MSFGEAYRYLSPEEQQTVTALMVKALRGRLQEELEAAEADFRNPEVTTEQMLSQPRTWLDKLSRWC